MNKKIDDSYIINDSLKHRNKLKSMNGRYNLSGRFGEENATPLSRNEN